MKHLIFSQHLSKIKFILGQHLHLSIVSLGILLSCINDIFY